MIFIIFIYFIFFVIDFLFFVFFFNDTATTEIYTLSLHDALPISGPDRARIRYAKTLAHHAWERSEEHTSELQSRFDLVCRLLLEKKKKTVLAVGFQKQTNNITNIGDVIGQM